MAMSLDDFHEDFFQGIVTSADADGELKEDSFFELFCSHLVEAGVLETADRARFSSTRGLRIDGYGGDPADSDGALSLIIVEFNQGPAIQSMGAKDMGVILKRATKFLTKSLDRGFRDGLEETSAAFGLADLIAGRWKYIGKVRIILATNKQLSARVSGKETEFIEGKNVAYDVWDIDRLHRYVSAGQAREDIEIDLVEEFGGALSALPAHLPGKSYESYLAVVPGKTLAAIYDRWGPRLLEQNVRVFLQARGKVNKGLRNTLDNEPGMFFAYNNGITATAESVELESTETGVAIRSLNNFQIVNGGQTTASIYAASRRKDCDLSDVFVQMKLSVIDPSLSLEVVPKISEYANSQNRVNAADFFANHPYHVRMEGFSRRIYAPSAEGSFRQSKWFYERARGQYQDARGDRTPAQRKKFDLECPKRQMFSKTDLAKFLMVWKEVPHTVSTGAQKNFAAFALSIGKEWNGEAAGFNDRYFQHAVAKAIVFRRTEKIVSEQEWYSGGYRANIVAYAIAKMAHDVREMQKVVDFDLIWKKQGLSRGMEKAIAIVAKRANAVIVNTPDGISNVTEWAKKKGCWERFKEAEIAWSKAWCNELLNPGQEKQEKRKARKEQRQWNEVEAQVAAVQQGKDFWIEVQSWGMKRKMLTPDEFSVLDVMASRVPSGKQSLWAIRIFERLQTEGCPLTLNI